jgi:hypothetical protein
MKITFSITLLFLFSYFVSAQTKTTRAEYLSNLQQNEGIKIGLDVPLFFTRSFVHVPKGLQGIITDHNGGWASDLGLGLNIDFNDNISLKFGFHKWNKLLNANYNGFVIANNGNQVDLLIQESGSFNYIGLYMKVHYNLKLFFIGGGFELSLNKKYNSNYSVSDTSGNLIFSAINQANSPLIENYNHQFDFSMITGLRFKINQKIILKPAIEFTVPFQPIINTGVYYTSPVNNQTTEVNISAFALKFGTVIEFEF